MHITNEKKSNQKRLHNMFLTMWQSGKGKLRWKYKNQGLPVVYVRGAMNKKRREDVWGKKKKSERQILYQLRFK